LWDKKDYELQESDLQISFNAPVLYDLYEKQKQSEAQMAIYKLYSDNDEMSKSLAMKKCLGWTDAEIDQNFKDLIKDKQLVAIAEYFSELISDENPPVDYKSPIRLKNEIEEVEKTFSPE
jgi:predicted DNA-binding transcriptional regulator AlpA